MCWTTCEKHELPSSPFPVEGDTGTCSLGPAFCHHPVPSEQGRLSIIFLHPKIESGVKLHEAASALAMAVHIWRQKDCAECTYRAEGAFGGGGNAAVYQLNLDVPAINTAVGTARWLM